MDAETRRKLADVEKETQEQGDSELIQRVLKDCSDFQQLQREVEEQSKVERKRALDEVVNNQKAADERYRAEVEDIRNYQPT